MRFKIFITTVIILYKSSSSEGNDAALIRNKLKYLRNNHGIKVWPDFSCIRGWYDVDNRDFTHPLATTRGAGVAKFDIIIKSCDQKHAPKNFSSPVEARRCQKRCILEELHMVKSDTGKKFSSHRSSAMIRGLGSILTDEGAPRGIVQLVATLYPALEDPSNWAPINVDSSCANSAWDDLFNLVEYQIISSSNDDCLNRKTEYNIEDEYHSRYVKYTANMDLSCHDAFLYKGIDNGEGDMPLFIKYWSECYFMLSDSGITEDCHTSCMFEKIGLIEHERDSLSHAHFLTFTKETVRNGLSKMFTGPNKEVIIKNLTITIYNECEAEFYDVQDLTCAQMGIFEDCIEQYLSCVHTGQFLKHAVTNQSLIPVNKEGEVINTEGNFDKVAFKDYPKMSCRNGYAVTTGFNSGSELLRKYRTSCVSLLRHFFYSDEDTCILAEMGVIHVISSHFEEPLFQNKFNITNVDDMTDKLARILAGFGGWDASYQIAQKLNVYCSHLVGPANGKSDVDTSMELLQLLNCINSYLDCSPKYVYSKKNETEDYVFADTGVKTTS